LYNFAPHLAELRVAILSLALQFLDFFLGRELALARHLVHLNGAINFVLQRVKIVGRNLFSHLFRL